MNSRRMILSCNLLLTASIEEDGDGVTVTLDDARHASIGYANGDKLPDEVRSKIGRKIILLGLQALMEKFNTEGDETKADPEVTLMQKGADA